MAYEEALLTEARSHMLANRARAIVERESVKGCTPDISPEPVALEPDFQPIRGAQDLLADPDNPSCYVFEQAPSEDEMVHLKVWLGDEQECDWTRSELFGKQLQSLMYRLTFEIMGNDNDVAITIMCHKQDEPVVKAAFYGEFIECELSSIEKHPLGHLNDGAWKRTAFRDYFTPPPYSHLVTRSNELRVSPFEPFVNAVAGVPAPAIGIYQAVFQPVAPDHNWHQNVQVLMDLEYKFKLYGDSQFQQRYAQQSPSGDLRGMAVDIDTKSHSDKPFFAAAVRVGIAGAQDDDAESTLRALSTFMCLFQHGGHQMNFVTEHDYLRVLSHDQVKAMFRLGLTYRPGFLVNSSELAGFVHIPSVSILKNRDIPLVTLDRFSAPKDSFTTGTHIGTTEHLGKSRNVYISPRIRGRHGHLIGRPDTGKSSLAEYMSFDDMRKGHGVAIIDPHGDLAERIISLLPEDCIERTIYFEPGNPEWIPLWNPMKLRPGQDPSRAAGEIVTAIKSISDGWGDRLGTLLQHGIAGLMHVEDATMLDVAFVLKAKVDKNDVRRKRILKAVKSQLALEFWGQDVNNYGKADFAPAQHKLNKLLSSYSVELMLSQPENRIDFQRIMDDGMIFVANLSGIGSGARDVLGTFILSFLHLAALNRSTIPLDQRKPFHIYADEAPRFVKGPVEDLIAETRKYNVSMILAHQYLKQFKPEALAALGLVGSTIVFNVNQRDAEYLTKVLGGDVEARDLTSLGVGEAIARIGTEVVRITTPMPRDPVDTSVRDRVIQMSRERYCKRTEEIQEIVKTAKVRTFGTVPVVFRPPVDNNENITELIYEEL